MSETTNGQPDDFDLILPWYQTGRLPPEERALIEAALATDEEKRRHLAIVGEEEAETIALNEALPAAPAASFERLMAKIDLYEAQHSRRHQLDKVLGRIAAWLEALSPRALAWSAVAAALVICVQAGLLGGLWVSKQQSATYETASLNAGEDHGTYALVSFVDTAPLMEVTDFLRHQHAALRDGPKPGGFYRIKISDQALSEDALKAKLAEMRAHKGIISIIVPEPSQR